MLGKPTNPGDHTLALNVILEVSCPRATFSLRRDTHHSCHQVMVLNLIGTSVVPNRTRSGVGIVAAYRSLTEVAPACAFLFAQSLAELRLMVEASDLGVPQKVANMSGRIDQLRGASGVSSRLSSAALWLVRNLVVAKLGAPGAGLGYRLSYDEIAAGTLAYRELTPADSIQPTKPILVKHLGRDGHKTLADAVQEIEERFAKLAEAHGADIDRLVDSCRQACWRRIAVYDALLEVYGDRFQTRLSEMERAIGVDET